MFFFCFLKSCSCTGVCSRCAHVLSGAAGCASPRMRMTARPSGCVRAAAAAPPSGCTRPVCSAGWTRSSGATARLASPARSAMPNTSLSFPSWVGEISSIFKSWLAWRAGEAMIEDEYFFLNDFCWRPEMLIFGFLYSYASLMSKHSDKLTFQVCATFSFFLLKNYNLVGFTHLNLTLLSFFF